MVKIKNAMPNKDGGDLGINVRDGGYGVAGICQQFCPQFDNEIFLQVHFIIGMPVG